MEETIKINDVEYIRKDMYQGTIQPDGSLIIDGVKYIQKKEFDKLKEELEKKKEIIEKPPKDNKFDRWKPSVENKIHNALNKIIGFEPDCMPENVALQGMIWTFDPANVMMIKAKSMRARALLRRYISRDRTEKDYLKEPNLNYEKDYTMHKCKFSLEYFNNACQLFLACKESKEDYPSFHVLVKKDYPITLYNEDWEIILAPRVDSD